MKKAFLGVVSLVIILLGTVQVFAAQSSSTNYQVNEVQFGAGSLQNATSTNYKAQENLGATAVGTTNSTNYYEEAGFLTPNVPFLAMIVTPATINLGTLTSTSAATGYAQFSVRAYTDSGYVVESMNSSPVNEEGKYLKDITTAATSSIGTEQFGINLVQNQTSCTNPAPANYGANPVPIPNSTYATGIAAPGYNTCGLFQYNKGDTVAESNVNGWGETDYTISYLANIAPITNSGTYNMTQDLVVVPTY